MFGTLIRGVVDESKMPSASAGRVPRDFWCTRHPHTDGLRPGWFRHGDPEGSGSRGCQTDRHPAQGNWAWSCRGRPRDGQNERGKTEGIIGTLKTDKYGFNSFTERLWHTLEMAGPRSILSYNLNKTMRICTGQQMRQKGIGVSRTTNSFWRETRERQEASHDLKGVLRHALVI